MNYNVDYTLYLVTNRELALPLSVEEAVEQAIRGGVTLVQLRDKKAGSRELFQAALALKKITDRYSIPLIINDRADIMLASGAAGVHVGQSDLPAGEVRRIIGLDKILGVSAATVEEAIAAEKAGADYLGVGAMFPTSTKKDTRHPSVDTLHQICCAVSIPVVAIGGINSGNAALLGKSGIAGAAVVSAILAGGHPEEAAAGLKAKIRNILQETGKSKDHCLTER